MKFPLLLLLALTLSTLSCKKASDDVTPTATTLSIDVKAVLLAGNWTIGSFRQRTEDKSSGFKGITFVFSADGTVTAAENNKTTKGIWIYSPAVTYYGGNGLSSLTINIGTSKPFELLNETWNINAASTPSGLKLDHKEPAEDEHVEFVKL